MIFYIDFETDGLDGNITEATALDENGKVFLELKDCKSPKKFFKKIINYNSEDNTIVFWHNFMITYLSKNKPKIFKILAGKYICFNNIYSFMNNISKSRYRIQDITKDLVNRDHKGDSLNDAKDLYDCIKVLKGRINNGKF